MHQLTKLLSYSCLLIVSQYLYASLGLFQKDKEAIAYLTPKKRAILVYGYTRAPRPIPNVLHELIQYFLHGNTLEYRGKALPRDLSGRNLSGFDFTGCRFIDTKLMDTNLDHVILDSTTCEYDQHSRIQYIHKNKLVKLWWPDKLRLIPKNLAKIQDLYSQLKTCPQQRANLLYIASALAELYISLEEYSNHYLEEVKAQLLVKLLYWFFSLYILKKQIVKEKILKGKIIDFSFEEAFQESVEFLCWQPKQPNKLKTIQWQSHKESLPKDIANYAKSFMLRLETCTEVHDYLSEAIQENIEALQEIYLQLKKKKIKRAVFEIAYLLSHTPELSKEELMEAYLVCQVGLVTVQQFVEEESSIKLKKYIVIKPPRVCL